MFVFPWAQDFMGGLPNFPGMNPSDLLEEIRTLLGPDGVCTVEATTLTLPAIWSLAPLFIASPASAAEAAAVIKAAEAAQTAVLPIGNGTQLTTGYPPAEERPYLLLRTDRLNHVLDHQPDDLTVTCESGVTLNQLQGVLATRHQELPLDAPLPHLATLGGLVATATSGFRRAAYGAPRDLLIGMKAVMTGGVEVKGGGKVVKNVAGYDVCKLFTGAWGTVGLLTQLTFKVRPLPEARRTLAFPMPNLAVVSEVGLALHQARLAPTFLLATNRWNDMPALIIGLEGTAERVEWQAGEFTRRVSQETGSSKPTTELPAAALEELREALAAPAPIAARIACLPTEIVPLVRRLEALGGVRLLADCSVGILHVSVPEADGSRIEAIRSALPPRSNCLWLHLPPDAPEAIMHSLWGEKREDAPLHRALKQTLDPHNTFSPGRFYNRL